MNKLDSVQRKLASLTPEERSQYRSVFRGKLAHVLQDARRYRGQEEQDKRLLTDLVDYEQWLASTFGDDPKRQRLTDQEEEFLMRKFHPKHPRRTINNILGVASSRFEHYVKKLNQTGNAQEVLQELQVLTIDLDGVVMPPGLKSGPITGSGVGGFEDIKLIPRLEQLVVFLNQKGIYTDDIVLCSGKLWSEQMREQTYYIVEIPRIEKEILICNQVGEATFVIDGIMSRKMLVTLSKDQLQKQYPDQLSKIIYRAQGQWEEELEKALFAGLNVKETKKIDVKSREEIRNEILKEYTPDQWLKMPFKERMKVKVNGNSERLLARLFGIEGDPVNNTYYHFKLGVMIYGEDNLQLLSAYLNAEKKFAANLELGRNIEKWKEEIQKVYTVEQWLGMSSQETRREINVKGKKEVSLASMFEINGNPLTDYFFHLELGMAIYGNGYEVLLSAYENAKKDRFERLEIEKQADDLEKLKAEIRKVYTAEQWLHMRGKERDFVSVGGLSEVRLARMLKVPGNPVEVRYYHLQMGVLIWGDSNSDLLTAYNKVKKHYEDKGARVAEANVLGNDVDKWREVIRSFYTVDQWIKTGTLVRKEMRIKGKTLTTLARVFGLRGNPKDNKLDYLALGLKVFGEDQPELLMAYSDLKTELEQNEKIERELGKDADRWREEIQKVYSAKQWANMTFKERWAMKLFGKAENAIARIFGVSGNPVNHANVHFKFGLKLYGEDNPDILQAIRKYQMRKGDDMINA